jgi:hypothetical protein
MYTVIQNFGFPLPKHSGRHLLRKFRVKNIHPKLQGCEPKLHGFEPKLRGFEPILRVCEPKLRGFEPILRVFEPKLRVFLKLKFRVFKPKVFILQGFFFPNETSGVDSGIFCDRNFGVSNPYEVSVEPENRRHSRSFVRK